MTDENIVLHKSEHLDDWYTIERASDEGVPQIERVGGRIMRLWLPERLSDACIEGTADEMRDIAVAILARREVRHKRCAVDATDEVVKLWSPRNSTRKATVLRAVAEDFARRALATLAGATRE